MENLNKMLVPLIVIVAFMAGFVLRQVIPEEITRVAPPKQAAITATNFINQIFLKGKNYVPLVDISKEQLYKISYKIGDSSQALYMSKDSESIYMNQTQIPEEVSDLEIWEVPKAPKTEIPRAQLFVMSFCPYGNMAEELMIPVDILLKDKANIEVHYVIYSNYGGGGLNYCLDKDDKYCSMHGIQELNQDIRELCVQKYQKDKLWDFLTEINNQCDYKNVDSCWEGTAKEIGIDINQIKSCQKSEALDFLVEELELNQEYGISGSPQLIINGVEYLGLRNVEAYKKGICSAFISPPFECSLELESEGGAVSGGCQ